MIIDVVKVFVPASLAFALGILLAPFLTHYLYKYRAWKKRPGKTDFMGNDAPTFNALHKEREVNTPRMGGIIIWASTALTVFGVMAVAKLFPGDVTEKLNFFTRETLRKTVERAGYDIKDIRGFHFYNETIDHMLKIVDQKQ